MLLLVCIPAAGLVAIAVEKKRHTFTVGGAPLSASCSPPG